MKQTEETATGQTSKTEQITYSKYDWTIKSQWGEGAFWKSNLTKIGMINRIIEWRREKNAEWETRMGQSFQPA